MNAKELKCIIKYERNPKVCAANSTETFIVMNGQGWRGHARKSTCSVICWGLVCTAMWIPGVVLALSHAAHGDLCPYYCNWHCLEQQDTQGQLKLSYNPWFFPTCLPRAISTPLLPAPDTAKLHSSKPLAVMHHLLPCLLLLLTPCFSSVLLFSFLDLQRIKPCKPPSSEGTIPASATLMSALQNMTNNTQL